MEELELQLLQQIKYVIDVEDAGKALSEPGKNIPATEFWNKLGL